MPDSPEPTPPEPVPPEPPESSEPISSESASVPHRSRRWLSWLLKAGAGIVTVVVIGGVVFLVWGDHIVTELLLPRVATAVDDAIKRPAELGDVEGFSFWGVKLGKTVIPPTGTDATTITVDEIEVTIGLRSLIFQQTLKSNVILTRPNVSLVQAEDGSWTSLRLPESSDTESRVKTEIQSIKVIDAELIAVPYVEEGTEATVARQPIRAGDADALVEFFGEDAKAIACKLTADVEGGDEDGELDINGEANLNEQAVKATVQVSDLPAAGANIFLPNTLGLTSGVLDANVTAAVALNDQGALDEDAVDVRGTARFREGELIAGTLPAPVRDIESQLVFDGQAVSVEDTSLQLNETVVTVSGDVDWDAGYDLAAQIPAVSVAEVQALADFDLPVPVEGDFALDVAVVGELEKPTVTGQLASAGPVRVDRLSLESVTADFELTAYVEGVALPTQLSLNELQVRPAAGGFVVARGQADITDLENPQFQLVADADLPVDSLAAAYEVELPEDVVIGDLTAEIQAGGTLRSESASESTSESAFASAFAQWQLSESTFPGTGEISWRDGVVALEITRLQAAGGDAVAEAVLQLESGVWQADVTAQQIAVSQFTRQASGLLNADIDAAGNLDALNLEAIQAQGTAVLADAQVQVSENSAPLLDRGDWRTTFVWEGDRIAVDSFTAPGVEANGTVGVDIDEPRLVDDLDLTVALRSFDLQPLNSFVPATVTDYGQLTGFASFDGQLSGTLNNPQIIGDARLNDLAVNELLFEPMSGPAAFSLAEGGQVDLQGAQDRLQVALRDTAGDRLPYWPASFTVQNQEFVVEGYGEGRSIYADITQLPLEALGVQPVPKYGFGTVTGLLNASVDVNLADFSRPTAEGTVTIDQPSLSPVDADLLTASFAYANDTATVSQGELLLDESRYLLSGSANLADEIAYEGVLTIAEGRIEDIVPIVQQLDLSGFGVGDDPTVLGSAADVVTDSVGLPPTTFAERLESFVAFVESQPSRENTSENASRDLVLPAWEDLNGAFTGVIEVAGQSLDPAALTADFDIRGERWAWGTYTEEGESAENESVLSEFASNEFASNEFASNEFVLVGEIEQQGVEIETAFVNAGETQIDLAGSGDLDQLDGQLTVERLPVELVELVYPLPAEVTGDLDLVATFDGSLANPVVEGEASVSNTRLNGYAVETVVADFDYRNALLDLDSAIALEPTENPITIAGTVPYALPFMTAVPRTNQIDLQAIAPNNSFEVINAFSDDRVRWRSGQGEVVVDVGGTLSQPRVVGQASFRDAAITSNLVRDDITNLNGDIQFTLDQVTIQQLQASVGDGRLAIEGRLPLLLSGQSILSSEAPLVSQLKQASSQMIQAQMIQAQTAQAQTAQDTDGLLISLVDLPVDYDGLLEAEFEGQMLVTGAVLAPTVSGTLEVNDGQVLANQLLGEVGSLTLPSEDEVTEISPYRVAYLDLDPLAVQPGAGPTGLLDAVALQNLNLILGDRLAIIGQPFYSLNAVGSLAVNGSLASLQPQGTIELKSGWINLFSTQFRLDRGATNTALFTQETGLDPYVDVVLRARVQDADITPKPPVPGGFVNADVNESQVDAIGDVEYVRVQAVAQGPASELSDSLVLTSNSSRSQGQLLALLGSNVFSDITGASYLDAAEFLGVGRFSGFGDRIADAVGLNYFSVAPTTDTGDEGASGLGLSVEASASLSNRFDIDFAQVLNSDDRPQLGVQYRLTDDFQVRGASNLNETEFELEYRIEF
ncbi:MAG: translocation/assembly module TamB domain-containing protein [Phormidesmis sp.]